MSPEILANKDNFDGFAVDMWAIGVALFIMLTGVPPWDHATDNDERYRYISNGYLEPMLMQWNMGLSNQSMDLLQRMLFKNPQDRLSLRQVLAHPWMAGDVTLPPDWLFDEARRRELRDMNT
jgi:serine/threonine protein kinase